MSKNLQGTFALIATAFFYGLYGVFSRFIGAEFGTFTQNAMRNIVIILVMAVFLIVFYKRKKFDRKHLPLLFFWAVCGFIATITTFIAYNHLTIATALLIFYSGSISISYFLGHFLYNEKMNVYKYISLAMAFIGLIIITLYDLSVASPIYIITAFVSGLTAGIWFTISKSFSTEYPNAQLIFFDALVNIILSTIFAFIFVEKMPSMNFDIFWFLLILFGIVQLLATVFVVWGYENTEAQRAALITPLDIVFSTFFAYLFFQEGVNMNIITGGVLIFVALILPYLYMPKAKAIKTIDVKAEL